MRYSNHAKQQSQRRGINQELIDIVELYGEEIKSNRGCRIIRVRRKEVKEVRSDFAPIWRQYRDKFKISIVISGETRITVKHQYKRLWKKLC